MSRLPTPGSDIGKWGNILNDYLSQSHAANGTLKAGSVGASQLQSGSVDEVTLTNAVQTKLNAPATINDGSITKAKLTMTVQGSLDKADSALQIVPDATASAKGAVQLTGDLGGTATNPTVTKTYTKSDVGLGNVDNTADAAKPVSTATQAALDSKLNSQDLVSGLRSAAIPTGLGWANSPLPGLQISVPVVPGGPGGSVNYTPRQAFALFSDTLTNPAITLYVDPVNGSDSNTGTSSATPVLTLEKARQLQVANAGKALIRVKPGFVQRSGIFTAGGFFNNDVAILADGGRVVVSYSDVSTFPTFAVDTAGSRPNAYKATFANVGRVFDTANYDTLGNYRELIKVASADLCNATPNSWYNDGTSQWVRRVDGAAPATTNTKMMRSSGNQPIQMTGATPYNLYIGGVSEGDGFDFEGSSGNILTLAPSAATSSVRALVVDNCTFKYGGAWGDGTRLVGIDSFAGLVYLHKCRGDASMTDFFNLRNTRGSSKLYGLTVNCSGFDNGRAPNDSCNAWTGHDDVTMIDVAGDYRANHGGTCASVNTAKGFLAGTRILDDKGALQYATANVIGPTAVYVRDAAEYWCDGVVADMPAGSWAFNARAAGSKIHLRNCPPTRGAIGGLGTVDSY